MGCASAKGVEEPRGSSATSAAPKRKTAPVPAAVLEKKVSQAKTTGVLALRECGLKQLPASATGPEMASLRMVDITANWLKSLPEAVGGWSGLQKLACSENQLASLPPTIGQLVTLQSLILSTNCLSSLPVELNQLGKLKILKLDDNQLAKAALPEDVFGGAMSSALEELDMSGNALEAVPASLTSLSSLQRLSLDRNRLAVLPKDVGRLKKLQYFNLAENCLVSLPDGMFLELTSLSDLWLKANPMERLKLQESPGFDAFLARRKERLDHKIEANVVGRVDLAVCGLD